MNCLCCEGQDKANWCQACERFTKLRNQLIADHAKALGDLNALHAHYHSLAAANEKLILWDSLQDFSPQTLDSPTANF